MKGIILAGGSATRLRPASLGVSKQLMPVFDKPMIYYPLTTLMLSGIREILIISTPNDLPQFRKLFSNSYLWGIDISFAEQPNPGGLAEALLIGEGFINGSESALILGDNLFYGSGFRDQLQEPFVSPGALICAQRVDDPRAFGVVEIDSEGVVKNLEEKPDFPRSTWAVPGLYFYDQTAVDRTKTLNRSPRGELEITDLNQNYLLDGLLRVRALSATTTWLDMGTPSNLLKAAEYVRDFQEREGVLIGSPEECAWRAGWIDDAKLIKLAHDLGTSNYCQLLSKLPTEEI
jgi:glucose-1-phosphate thymidylyltransferase